MIAALTVMLVAICVVLMVVILLQSARGAGLGGMLSGGAEQFFGKRRGVDTFLSRLTVALGIAFFLIAMLIAYIHRLPPAA